ncbi:MAG TPA: DUF3500 domain-containing protein [Xanthobacteraceae bacterium]
MAGETAHFGLRPRPPVPAVRPFELPPMIKAMRDRGEAALAEPFRGITGAGGIVPGLFAREPTGVSLASLAEAVRSFLAALTAEQRKAACFTIEDEAWRHWSNIHPWLMRHGVCLADLDGGGRERALALLRETMSAAGYGTARDIMRLNEHMLEVTGRAEEYSEWFYWVSLFGMPSSSEPWGWQIDGHHLNLNGFVLGDQLVLTPGFMGSEPVLARSGKYAGTRVFATEEEQGLALMRALSVGEQARATIGKDLPGELLGAAFSDNRRIEPAGIRYGDLPVEGRERLAALLATYTGRIRPGHAEVRYGEVKRHLDDTHFAWIGPCDDVSPFYYRIFSPVILVEFDHVAGIVYDNDKPTRDHIHTVVRTPNGNDYGRDLLRQHYAEHHHRHDGTTHAHHHHGAHHHGKR